MAPGSLLVLVGALLSVAGVAVRILGALLRRRAFLRLGSQPRRRLPQHVQAGPVRRGPARRAVPCRARARERGRSTGDVRRALAPDGGIACGPEGEGPPEATARAPALD